MLGPLHGEERVTMGQKTTEKFFGKVDDKSVEISVTQRVTEDAADNFRCGLLLYLLISKQSRRTLSFLDGTEHRL